VDALNSVEIKFNGSLVVDADWSDFPCSDWFSSIRKNREICLSDFSDGGETSIFLKNDY